MQKAHRNDGNYFSALDIWLAFDAEIGIFGYPFFSLKSATKWKRTGTDQNCIRNVIVIF